MLNHTSATQNIHPASPPPSVNNNYTHSFPLHFFLLTFHVIKQFSRRLFPILFLFHFCFLPAWTIYFRTGWSISTQSHQLTHYLPLTLGRTPSLSTNALFSLSWPAENGTWVPKLSLLCCLRLLCTLRPHKHTHCKPSMLQWINRSTDLRNWTTAFEGFTLTIRDTHQGSIPWGPRESRRLPDRPTASSWSSMRISSRFITQCWRVQFKLKTLIPCGRIW